MVVGNQLIGISSFFYLFNFLQHNLGRLEDLFPQENRLNTFHFGGIMCHSCSKEDKVKDEDGRHTREIINKEVNHN